MNFIVRLLAVKPNVSAISNVNCVRLASSNNNNNELMDYERIKYARRFGNKVRHHDKGLLPRLSRKEVGLPTIPVKSKPDPWHPKIAYEGQNDYIDILGTGNTHPATLLKHIPEWLRGWSGHEMEMLQRKAAVEGTMKLTRPEKWHWLQKRLDYLYKYRNRTSKPPKIFRYR